MEHLNIAVRSVLRYTLRMKGVDAMRDYWLPKLKPEVVDWLHKFYGGKYPRGVFRARTRRELLGWYVRLRKQLEMSR